MTGRTQRAVASYALSDGKFAISGTGRGKDLYVRRGVVHATGFPLYWRPEDDHFLSSMELELPGGVVIALNTNPIASQISSLSRLVDTADPAQKPTAAWTNKALEEIAAVAMTQNAVLITGVDRHPLQPQKTEAALCAIDLATGKQLWKQVLPAAPSAWGLAVDRDGQMIVTLIDGRVLCFAGK
jgi:hypothetical protein